MTHGSLTDFTHPRHADAGTASEPRRVALIGSTGSIGTQGLDVIARSPERFRAVALAGGANTALLAEQAVRFAVEAVGAASGTPEQLRAALADAAARLDLPDPRPHVVTGPAAATEIAAWSGADTVLNGITGSIGLRPTLAALAAGHRLALANKESLIVGGALVKAAAAPGQLVPVDSEHSALAQALRGGTAEEVRRLVLTASGGPFRGWSAERLRDVTPAQALAHPTWDMGRVVTTNSASLVNKALEVVEAHLLFDVPLERIDVVVHPQSVVHSLVEFTDGSTLAQASPPDMRLPIALGIGWPHRVTGAAAGCDWTRAAQWTFEPLDSQVFPAVELMKHAGSRGGTWPAVFNAANEQAVHAFHRGALGFTQIVDMVERVLEDHDGVTRPTLEDVLGAEEWARARADERIAGMA